MIATAFGVFLFVFLVPVWLPVLLGLLLPGIRLGARGALVVSGTLAGLYASLGRSGEDLENMRALLLLPVPTMVLSGWLIITGLCLVTAHRYARANNAANPRCIASVAVVALNVLLGPLMLYPYLDHALR